VHYSADARLTCSAKRASAE